MRSARPREQASKRTRCSRARRRFASSIRQSTNETWRSVDCGSSIAEARQSTSFTRCHTDSAKSQPDRSQRTSSTSTRRARSNRTPAWRAPTTRSPMASPSSSSSSAAAGNWSGELPGVFTSGCSHVRAILDLDVVIRPPSEPLLHRSTAGVAVPTSVSQPGSASFASLVARDLTKSYGPRVVLDHVSCTVGPMHRVGVVAPNGTGKSTLLKILAGIDAPDSGTVTRTPPTATVGYLPQEPERRAGRDGARVPRAPDGGDPRRGGAGPRVGRARRATTGRRRHLRRGPRALSRARRGRLRRPARCGVRRPRSPDPRARSRHALVIGWAGRACEPRRDRARPLRRVPARRAHQRPRLRRARAIGTVPARRADRRRRHRVARSRVPRPHDHVGARARRAPALGHGVRRWMAVVSRRTRDRPPSRRGGVRRLPRPARRAARPGPAPAPVVGAGQGEVEEVGRERQEHPRVPAQQQRARRGQGQDHRSRARAARGERDRQAVGGLGSAHGDRDRAPQRRDRRASRWSDRAPRRLRSRSDRPPDRVRRTGRDRRLERDRQDDAARRPRSDGGASTTASDGSVRA